jgi:hypothetical protein
MALGYNLQIQPMNFIIEFPIATTADTADNMILAVLITPIVINLPLFIVVNITGESCDLACATNATFIIYNRIMALYDSL